MARLRGRMQRSSVSGCELPTPSFFILSRYFVGGYLGTWAPGHLGSSSRSRMTTGDRSMLAASVRHVKSDGGHVRKRDLIGTYTLYCNCIVCSNPPMSRTACPPRSDWSCASLKTISCDERRHSGTRRPCFISSMSTAHRGW